MDNSAYNTTVTAASPSQESTYFSTAKKNLTEALYAKAGRRYGTDNRINKFARKNRFRNGKHMLCRGCNSDSHLIRHCPTLRKADLVNYIPSDW